MDVFEVKLRSRRLAVAWVNESARWCAVEIDREMVDSMKTVVIEIHIDLDSNSNQAADIQNAIDHLIEGIRVDGIGAFYSMGEERRPDIFKETK